MKKFITILMSLNLIMAPVAFAQEASDQFVANPEAKKRDSGGLQGQILSLAQSIAGTQAIMCNPKAPSMLIYLAGSVAYITSEMLGAKAQVEQLKKKASDIKMLEEKMRNSKGGGEVQKEALEQALKEQKDSLAFVKKRKTWLMAITAIYTAATIAAILETFPPRPPSFCTANVKTGLNMGTALAAVYSFGISKASKGGILSMAPMLMVVIPGAMAKMNALMKTGPTRAALYGASAIGVGIAMGELGQKATFFDENIKLLEKAIKDFEASSTPNNGLASDLTTAGSSGGDTSGNSDGSTGAGTIGTTAGSGGSAAGVVKTLPVVQDSSIPKQCFTQTSEGMQYSEAGCTSPIKLQAPTFDASLAVPTLTSATQSATRMANALSAGDLGSAEVEAGTLGNMAGRLTQIRDGLIKKTNADLVAKGEKPIDYDADSRAIVADLEKVGGINSSGMASDSSGNGSSSGFGSNRSSTEGGLDANTTGAETMKIHTAGSDSAVGVPTSGAETSGVDAISEDALIGATGTPGIDPSKDANLAQKLNQFESNESDISDDADFSIFKQVSNRYLLNYPKIFDKKLEQPKRK